MASKPQNELKKQSPSLQHNRYNTTGRKGMGGKELAKSPVGLVAW